MNNTLVNRLGLFIGFVIIANICTILPPIPGPVYYACMIIALMIMALKCGLPKGCNMVILLFAGGVLSILFNDIPAFFRPWGRLASFVVLTSLLSPLFPSYRWTLFKIRVMSTIFFLLQFMILLSFVWFLTGQGYQSGYFRGISQHSMQMGPLASLCIYYSVFRIQSDSTIGRRMKYAYYLLIAMAFICMLQSGSRSALLGCIVGIIVYFYMRGNRNFIQMISKNKWIIIGIFVLSPFWLQYTNKIQEKQDGNVNMGGATYSREEHWSQRLSEWQSSPLFGIGFGAVDAQAEEGNNFDAESGAVETGSSWLCTLSMTGLIGFIGLLGTFIASYRQIWKQSRLRPNICGFLLAIQAFFTIHMFAEGYILSGGEVLSYNCWLLMGVMYGIGRNPILLDELEKQLVKWL